MKAKTLMIQGTGSHVGKSIITAALCRIFAQDGYRVAPFKSQNMSLNSFVTEEGGEMGRAQVVQAEACGIKPSVNMNPILLKPTTDVGAQVIVMGRPVGNMTVEEYIRFKPEAMKIASKALYSLMESHDILVIEGAGSPAEINLKSHDIVNMGIAEIAEAPVIVVGDIDKGGVFAWFIGTLELLDQRERDRVKGFIINKFRGRRDLLEPGLSYLKERTGKPTIGIIPYFYDIHLMEEDAVPAIKIMCKRKEAIDRGGMISIDVIYLPHISNFTDFDPFEIEPDVYLKYVRRPEDIDSPDILIIPGSKNTFSDLQYLKVSGMADMIRVCADKGTHVVGICGGYQMLGKRITDPYGVEWGGEAEGLGFLDIETIFYKDKVTYQVIASTLSGHQFSTASLELKGYEIHMGNTSYTDGAVPLFLITRRNGREVRIKDGAISGDGKVWGTYVHGIFDNDRFRRDLINNVKKEKGLGVTVLQNNTTSNYKDFKEEGYRRLAEVVGTNLDMERVYRIIDLRPAR